MKTGESTAKILRLRRTLYHRMHLFRIRLLYFLALNFSVTKTTFDSHKNAPTTILFDVYHIILKSFTVSGNYFLSAPPSDNHSPDAESQGAASPDKPYGASAGSISGISLAKLR